MDICFLTLGLRPYDDRLYYKEAWSCLNFAENVTIVGKPNEKPELVYPDITVKTYTPNQSLGRTLQEMLNLALNTPSDIYHLNEPHLLLLIPILRKRGECRIVYEKREMHGHLIRYYSDSPNLLKYPLSWSIDFLETVGSKFTDGLIYDSAPLLNLHGSASKPSVVIQNFPRIDLLGSQQPVETDDFVILYQGQIGRTRELERLIEGFTLFYNKTGAGLLKMVGAAPQTEYLKKLNNMAEQLGIVPQVELKPPVPHTMMPEIMSKASVGIMALSTAPIITKKVQIKMFEYMLAQLPIITAAHPAAEYFIGKTQSGCILEIPSPENVANALESLYANPEERKRMGKRGRARIIDEWNWSAMENELFSFYQQVLERP